MKTENKKLFISRSVFGNCRDHRRRWHTVALFVGSNINYYGIDAQGFGRYTYTTRIRIYCSIRNYCTSTWYQINTVSQHEHQNQRLNSVSINYKLLLYIFRADLSTWKSFSFSICLIRIRTHSDQRHMKTHTHSRRNSEK